MLIRSIIPRSNCKTAARGAVSSQSTRPSSNNIQQLDQHQRHGRCVPERKDQRLTTTHISISAIPSKMACTGHLLSNGAGFVSRPSQHQRQQPGWNRPFHHQTQPTRLCSSRTVRVAQRVRSMAVEQQQLAQAADPEAVKVEQPQQLVMQDDLDQLLEMLPADLGSTLINHPKRAQLIEVVLDLGRRPEARFQGLPAEYLRDAPVSRQELDAAATTVGEFGSDNRAGIPGTLHRISALRSRSGAVVGLTCRVGRAVSGHAVMVRDILEANLSVLFLGRPGVGKTTAIREIARTLSDELHKRVVIVDTSNEIGGDGDVPHPAIGAARRMQVADATRQHDVMIEAVENHMPEILIVDEIGTEAEALACRTIAERGVVLIGTAHGCFLENLIKNPTLSDLVGGVASVTLGDDEARTRGTQKSVLERKGPPTFPIVVEMRDRGAWVAHDTSDSVDTLLKSRIPKVQLRMREESGSPDGLTCLEVAYDQVEDQILAQVAQGSGPEATEAAAARAATLDSNNAASIDELVSSLLASGIGGRSSAAAGSTGSSGSSSPAGSSSSSWSDLDGVEPGVWLERFKGLTEAEALQELQVLKYLHGQTGVLRPRGPGGFAFGNRGPAPAPAAGQKKKKRMTKTNARRG